MKVKNLKVHDLYESIIRSGYPMLTGEPSNNLEKEAIDLKWWFEEGGLFHLNRFFSTKNFIPYSELKNDEFWNQILSKKALKSDLEMTLEAALKHYRRVKGLSSCKPSSGHEGFQKGILVSCDIGISHIILSHVQRYHWFELICSQSRMHRILQGEFKNIGNVLKETQDNFNNLIYAYNKFDELVEEATEKKSESITVDSNGVYININKFNGTIVTESFDGSFIISLSKKELFETIVANAPTGLILWISITTNYMQLKNMYNQRKNHKMSEWVEFCKIIKELPLFEKLILQEKNL